MGWLVSCDALLEVWYCELSPGIDGSTIILEFE